MSNSIIVRREGFIATVTLNRPEKHNAISRSMWLSLGDIMEELSASDDVRCVVLRGAGDKAFTAGADVSEFKADETHEEAMRYGEISRRAQLSIRDCRHPVVAMIRGFCLGGGMGVALMCDIRIAGAGSRLGIPANRVGAFYAYPPIERLIGAVGQAMAAEILLEGRSYPAEEAHRFGLVNRVVPDAELEAETDATARRIAEGAPLSARWHKRAIRRLSHPSPLTEAELNEAYLARLTEDFAIGFTAVRNKQKPVFVGR